MTRVERSRAGTSWLAWLRLALACAACAPETPQNLVFVSLDTTRRDHLSVYGFARETTPALERLAAKGVVFVA